MYLIVISFLNIIVLNIYQNTMSERLATKKGEQQQIIQSYQQPKLTNKPKSFKFGLKLDIPDSYKLEFKNNMFQAGEEQKKQDQIEDQLPKKMAQPKKSVFEQQKLKKEDRFLKKYQQIQQILGRGANGVVKKCKMIDSDDETIYAVKITKCEFEQKKNMIATFQKITQFDHENIIKYKAIYIKTLQNKAHLVMEYLPYKDLSKAKIESEDQLKYIAKKIIGAVDYMHDKGICHRDLKPQNIKYDPQTKILKIVDFGSSAIFKKRNKKQTQMATPTGTILYRPPQRFETGSYNQLIDEWAIGVILYQLVVGKTPFEQQSQNQSIQNIRKGTIQFDEKIWKKYSKELKQLVKQFLKPINQRITAKKALQHLWFPGFKNILQSTHAPQKPKPKMILTNGISQQPMTTNQKQNQVGGLSKESLMINSENICQSEDEYEAQASVPLQTKSSTLSNGKIIQKG